MTEETAKNNDGFVPGQDLSFADLMAMRAAKASGAPSREDIAEMGREDVIDLLKAHGVDAPKGKVDDLRARLISIMFADL
ncbi:hypothetical protein [Phaeobacter sp. S60]|uniref:hypothetical protein n=1 Tax=Phaeobacter sp. S60 TaxID=1569353 RepID=UPI00058C8C67|nr:hypothetical protein [Phaeobacter sp. S60]KII11762.1 hypothetical protein OO25_19645 [Phaeobacter sp. S60]